MRDYIGKDRISTTTIGNNNQSIIKSRVSNSNNINVIYSKIDELKNKIEQHYTNSDKKALLESIEKVKTLSGDKKNYSKIREILGGVIARTSEFAQIGAFVIELFTFFTGRK